MVTETLSDAAAALRQTSGVLVEAAGRMGDHDPGSRVFGGDASGSLGDLGRMLHQRWQRALDARSREAAALGARLEETADALVSVTTSYSDTDHDAARKHRGLAI